jgi:hypothetical protein
MYMLLHNCADLAEVGTSIFQIDKSIFDTHGSWISLSNYRFTKKINSLIALIDCDTQTLSLPTMLINSPGCQSKHSWEPDLCTLQRPVLQPDMSTLHSPALRGWIG